MSWFPESQLAAAADDAFLARVRAALERWPPPAAGGRALVAFSGGVDSTVLLATLVRLAPLAPVWALHVDHALHSDSARWSAHCARVAAALGVRYASLAVSVDRASGRGLEAAAREARYAAFAASLAPADVLLTAHHADDQLETLLLRLARGTGVRGLRGVLEHSALGAGRLLRPLLECTRAEIVDCARRWGLEWLEDPANRDLRHDRNVLRARVVPVLAERWPEVARSAERLARQMADAERILDDVAARDAQAIADPRRVPRAVLAALDPARQRNLLRYLLRRAGLAIPSAAKLEELRAALLDARDDSRARVRWPGGEGRVHRAQLYLLEGPPAASAAGYEARIDRATRWVGPEGELCFARAGDDAGLPETWLDEGVVLRFRAGGERFKPLGAAHSRPLKRWLADAGVVPWMRARIPLLYRAGRLVAVGDLWVADEVRSAAADAPRWRVRWSSHPPLT